MTLATLRTRRDTAANWAAANPILSLGEVAWETDTARGKVGNGSTLYSALPYTIGNATSSTTTISVMSSPYNAVGDGVTNDTTAIHAARDAAAAIGADLLFPSGRTFMVSQLTASTANQTWWCQGATIKGLASATSFIVKVTGANFTMKGGTLDGSLVANPTMDNPFQSTAAGTTWEGVTVKSSPGYGLKSINVGDQEVRFCTITNSSYEGIWFENGTASGINDIYDFKAYFNTVDGSSLGTGSHTSGITFWGGNSTHRVNRCTAVGNTVLLPSAQTFGAAGGVGVINGFDYTVDDNIVVGANIAYTFSNTGMGSVTGNITRGASIYGIELATTADNVTVGNNTVDGGNLATRGISCSAASTGVSIDDNTIRNLAGSGENSIYFTAATLVSCSGNTIRNTNNVAGRAAITFNGAINTVTLTGNTIDGGTGTTGVGIQWLGAATGLVINSNAFLNLTRACVLWGSASGATDFLVVVGGTQNNCAAMWLDAHSGSATWGANNRLGSAGAVYNASTVQQTGFATDTYLVNSYVNLPTTLLASKAMYRLRFNVTKTAAGTATPIISVRVGTTASTSDTAIATLTFAAQTAVADAGWFEIYGTFRAIGASAVMQVVGVLMHNLSATGLSTNTTDTRAATASSFNSTTAGNILGVSVNGGTSAAWTVELVQAELVNLAVSG